MAAVFGGINFYLIRFNSIYFDEKSRRKKQLEDELKFHDQKSPVSSPGPDPPVMVWISSLDLYRPLACLPLLLRLASACSLSLQVQFFLLCLFWMKKFRLHHYKIDTSSCTDISISTTSFSIGTKPCPPLLRCCHSHHLIVLFRYKFWLWNWIFSE